MPNHVHVVVHPRVGHDLSSISHSWKSFTSKQINRVLGRCGVLWQPEPYDHLIRDDDDFRHAVDYTLGNPRAANLIDWQWVGRGAGYEPVMNAIFRESRAVAH
jgi:REP element-mobilizing transposase RayT